MKLISWGDLPPEMQREEVREYYLLLQKQKISIFLKRMFDVVASLLLLIFLSPIFLIVAIAIKMDSKGPIFYRQIRVTQYGKRFRIHKFRSMRVGADKGSQVTVGNDDRITRVGKVIRKFRLDEIAQLIDVLSGNMTFVGTRPEVPQYVEKYASVMMATLLLPAGITSEASIYFKDESQLLENADDTDSVYIHQILPAKMYYNLNALKHFSFWKDLVIMIKTVLAVLGKEYKGDYEIKIEQPWKLEK